MSHVVHTLDSAPPAARETLAQATATTGFLPNLYGVLADAPAVLTAYLTLGKLFDQTSFTPTERQIVLLATSRENGCEYCVAAHTVIATMQRVPAEVIEAVRSGTAIADRRLEALRRFTIAMVAAKGHPAPTDLAAFHAAGYQKSQVLEVILGVGMKTISNYTNHQAATPLDPAFAAASWARVA